MSSLNMGAAMLRMQMLVKYCLVIFKKKNQVPIDRVQNCQTAMHPRW